MTKRRYRPFSLEKALVGILRFVYGEDFKNTAPHSDNALIYDLHDHLMNQESTIRVLRSEIERMRGAEV